MTDISINEMIVKVNAPAFHDNSVEASFQDVLSSPE